MIDSYEQELGELRTLAHEFDRSTREVLGRVREARGHLAAPQPLIAFVHIPKTAGSTALNMLGGAFTKQALTDAGNIYRSLDKVERKLGGPGGGEAWSRRGKRVMAGHVPYAIFHEHLPPGTRYMTFLREPVDRVLSHYYRHVHNPKAKGDLAARVKRYRDEGTAPASSLEEALVDMRMVQLRNLCTRFLCGHPSSTDELPDGALAEAKANLREFLVVGIQERFEESIVLLQRRLGIGLLPYWNRHVSVGRPGVSEISAEQRALIEEENRLDIELYEFATELFEEAVRAEGVTFARDVEQLQGLAVVANEEAVLEAQAWLEGKLPPGSVKLTNSLRDEGVAAGFHVAVLKNARTRVEHARRGPEQSPAQPA